MNLELARPDIGDLLLRVYLRSLHPELFPIICSRKLELPGFTLKLGLTTCGHVLFLNLPHTSLTEAITDREDAELFPKAHSFAEHKLNHCRTLQFDFGGKLQYSTSCQLERMEYDAFIRFHQELLHDRQQVVLSHELKKSARFGVNPLSLIRCDYCQGCLTIHTFHTFPQFSAVVKSQSLFEF